MTSSSLKAALQRGVAGWWTGISRVAGRVARWSPGRWASPGGRRVLVVAAHPDDEIGCGGTILLHARAGDDVHVLYATDGRGSRAGGLGPDAMAAARRREAAVVEPLLRLRGTRWLGLPEWEWPDGALVVALCEALRDLAPHLVYAPSRVDFHPEHVRVASCLARALTADGVGAPTVRVYQLQVPLTPLLVNLAAPIDAVVPELLGAMHAYRSQFASIERCQRMKRYAAAFYGLVGYVEEFWELDADSYRKIHAPGAEPAPGAGFRGVRWWPFTDPLAYLVGLGLRRRARAVAGDGALEAER